MDKGNLRQPEQEFEIDVNFENEFSKNRFRKRGDCHGQSCDDVKNVLALCDDAHVPASQEGSNHANQNVELKTFPLLGEALLDKYLRKECNRECHASEERWDQGRFQSRTSKLFGLQFY